ncbi:PKD domain-containing protein [Candidatus Peregrinibacteria bacterium]|nr:PKD domain-containing protein [Candidatus Peregrinibacteria bacterium]
MKKISILAASILFFSLFVSVPVASAAEVCEDINDWSPSWAQLDCGEGDDVVSFIGFEGGLSAPTGEGLDESLQRSKTLREFIVNTVNFALMFLGVIAMAIVVYGGFLYVTAAGNEEQSGKGKKTITYAVIGILIIIGSFALVNTLLTFGGGKEGDRGGRGSADSNLGSEEGTNISQQTIYNLAAEALSGSLNDFIGAYKNLVTMNGLISKITSLPKPGDDPREANNRRYLSAVTETVNQIKNSTNSLSKTHVAAQALLNGKLAELSNADLNDEKYENGYLKGIFMDAFDASGIKTAYKADFTDVIDGLISEDAKQKGKLMIVKDVLGEIATTQAGDLINRGLISEKDLQRAFSGISPTATLKDIFQEVHDSLKAAKELATADTPDTQKVVNVVRALDRLFIIIKNIEFVEVRIKATPREGNAPLIVKLEGLGSRDPTGATIADDQYTWDPLGNNQANTSECKPGLVGPTIFCTYNQPGTYIVRLKIPSQDPSRVATGQAFLPITIHPPVARIALTAKVGDTIHEIRKYVQDPETKKWKLDLDKNTLQVTKTEAVQGDGIEFDASKSESGGGGSIEAYQWTYGDGSGTDKTAVVKHEYKNEGKYRLQLEVTASGNSKDRKFLDVSVGSLAARIVVSKQESEPEELVEFDGSTSRSDKGAISSYEWKIAQLKDNNSTLVTDNTAVVNLIGNKTSPTLRARFKKPGSYRVTLTVSDGSGPKDDEAIFFVKSRKPRANFFMRMCPENCPGTRAPNIVELDASPSLDPDEPGLKSDAMNYTWTVFDDKGNELTPEQSYQILESKTVNDKVIKIEFPKTGKYQIQLTAVDKEPPEIQQSDIRTKEVNITSTVFVTLDANPPVTASLVAESEGATPEATFTFKGKALNADRLLIDFGDGNTDEPELATNKSFESLHNYAEAKSFLVTFTASSESGNGENTITHRIYVRGGDAPLAVIEASVDNMPVVLTDPTTDALEIIRRKTIKFSAANSLDSKGRAFGAKNQPLLTYSWDFGDGSKNTDKNTQHSYENVSPETGPYRVTLKVADKDDATKTNQMTLLVNVISKKPQVNTLAIEKTSAGNETPVEIKVTAEGASDEDGNIQSYQFWYYDPAEADLQLSPVTTYGKENNFAAITIETKGEEGEEHEYIFCVTVTDNENTTSECRELFQEEELPKIKVKNGPNKPPTVDFTIDKNQVRMNETVTFTANVTDPEGKPIAQYIWDFDGNGFQDDQPTQEATVQHAYARQSRGAGYLVKLKAVDDKGAAGFSKAIPVVVSANSNPPTVQFACQVAPDNPLKVNCFDQSRPDSANNAQLIKWSWDFNTAKQYGCDVPAGTEKPSYCDESKTNDIDSTDQNPTFTYPQGEVGRVQVQLTVEDSDGNTAEAKSFVELTPGAVAGTGGARRPNADILNAVLKAERANCRPASSVTCVKTDTLHIPVAGSPPTSPEAETVTFFYGESTGNISGYKIDKNIWCDSDGDGDRTNDWDNKWNTLSDYDKQLNTPTGCKVASTGNPADNCFTTQYKRRAKTTASPSGPGHFMSRLRVEDANDPINKYSNKDIEVVFDGVTRPDEVLSGNDCNGNPPSSTGSASLFKNLGTQNTILLSLIAGVIVVLIGSGAAGYFRRGKRRTH